MAKYQDLNQRPREVAKKPEVIEATTEVTARVTIPVSSIPEKTRLEQEAGRAKVAEYAAIEARRMASVPKIDGEIIHPPRDGRVQERFSSTVNRVPVESISD